MSSRLKAYALVALLLVLAWVMTGQFRQARRVIAGQGAGVFVPINVADPTLRIDDIAASQKREYQGQGRNIFSYASVRQQQVAPLPVKADPNPAVNDPPKPPPLTAPFKFYGIATNAATGRRRAFFTNGDDIWIAEEGQMIDRRFRLVSIGNTSAEVEEVSTGKRVTVALEELPGSSS